MHENSPMHDGKVWTQTAYDARMAVVRSQCVSCAEIDPHSHVTTVSPTTGMALARPVLTVALQKLICPHGRIYPRRAVVPLCQEAQASKSRRWARRLRWCRQHVYDHTVLSQRVCMQAVHDARKAVEEITVPPSAGRSEPATKTVVQAIAVAQALRSRVAHRLHYIASQTGILDADSDSSSGTRCVQTKGVHSLLRLFFRGPTYGPRETGISIGVY